MKKIMAAFLCATLLLTMLPVSALASPGDTYDDGYYSYYEHGEGLLTVTRYHGSYDNITLPSSYNGMPVTQVGNGAFRGHEQPARYVTLPDTISTIGERAFEDGVAWVKLNDTLIAIRYHGCASTGFTELVLPDSLKIMDEGAFSNCPHLKSVKIGKGLTTVSREAFSYCYALTDVTIPENVTSIQTEAFYSCHSLKSIKLPKNLQTIAGSAFEQTALTSIDIPNSVTYIGNLSFAHTKLTSFTIPKATTRIGTSAFSGCPLTKIIVLNPDITLDNDCFSNTALSEDGLYGIPGSTAEAYAQENNIPFHEYVPSPLPDENPGSASAAVAVETDILYTGGHTTLAPAVPGGKWIYDETMAQITPNEDGTYKLKALRAGNLNLHYTIGWADVDIPLTIRESALPQTGQDFTWVWIFAALAAILIVGGFILKEKRSKA
jgi:LPXTG-motif cell wall-anchored protein